MDKVSQDFLYKYLNANSPVSYETEGQKIWLDYIKPFINDYHVDTYGSVVGIINPDARFKVVIEAHADEISWYVHYITKEGYIYVCRNGGSDFQIAPSMRAKIHTQNEVIPAVFGWPAIHVREPKKDIKPDIDTVVLDCGCTTDKEVEMLGIHVGSVVTFDQDLQELKNDFLVGRALDNRMGGFMIAEVARKLKDNDDEIPFGLYIVNAVQEEIGLKGAQMMANHIKPDIALITDVTHDTHSPNYNKIKQGDISCKKGPVISYAPSIQRNVLKLLIDTATEYNIPFQRLAASRYTGTDTDAFAYSNSGVASALVSLPLKYMHTTVEMVHKSDINNVIELIYRFILNVSVEQDLRYIK